MILFILIRLLNTLFDIHLVVLYTYAYKLVSKKNFLNSIKQFCYIKEKV